MGSYSNGVWGGLSITAPRYKRTNLTTTLTGAQVQAGVASSFDRVAGLQYISVRDLQNVAVVNSTNTIPFIWNLNVDGGWYANSNGYISSNYDKSGNYFAYLNTPSVYPSNCTINLAVSVPNIFNITDASGRVWLLTFSPFSGVKPTITYVSGGVAYANNATPAISIEVSYDQFLTA